LAAVATRVAAARIQGRYRVLGRLGAGAQGAVYRVHDEVAGGEVALKIVAEANREDLADEFALLAQVRHPGIARAIDLEVLTQAALGYPAGSVLFTSELVPGEPLAGPPPGGDRNRWLAGIAARVLDALEVLHRRGLVHADLKPDHILVTEAGPVLVDFGLSGAPAPVRGTLPFMAPEVLAGSVGPAADLYALGVSLWTAVRGAPPFAGETAAELIALICRGRPEPVARGAAWLDPRLADLIDGLLHVDPECRPRSAGAALHALQPLLEELDLAIAAEAPLAPSLWGRDRELAALVDAMRALVAGDARAVLVAGPVGSGRRTLIDMARRRYQLLAAAGDAVPMHIRRANLDRMATAEAPGAHTIVEHVAATMRADPAVWIFDRPDERATAVVRAVVADPDFPAAPLVAVVGEAPGEIEDGVRLVALGPLADADAHALVRSLQSDAPPEELDAIVAAGAGNPALLIERCRAGADRGTSYGELIATQLAPMDAELARLALVLACSESPLPSSRIAALVGLEDPAVRPLLAALDRRGWLREDDEGIELRSHELARAIRDAAEPTARTQAYAVLAEEPEPSDWRQVRYALGAGRAPGPAAIAHACDALRAAGRVSEARGLAELGLAQVPAPDRPALVELAAQLALATGAYADVVALVDRHGGADEPTGHRLQLLKADAVSRSGDKQAARELLEAELDAHSDAETRARLARVLVDLGRHREVIDLVVTPRLGAEREALGLARLYLGELDAAAEEFRAAEAIARAGTDRVPVARALGLQGMVAQAQGSIVAAAQLYEQAAGVARESGDVHALAVYLLNRATADYERGHFASAMDSALRARRQFARLGPVAERAAAEYNLGLAALGLGDMATAEACAARASRVAIRHGNPQMRSYADILRGDLERRRGHLEAACEHYQRAIETAEAAGLQRDLAAMRRNHAECLALLGRAEAWDALGDASGTGDDRDRDCLTRARIALELDGEPPSLGDLIAVADRARESGRDDLGWRADLVAARVAYAAGDQGAARAEAVRARGGFERIRAQAPELARSGLAADPDHLALTALESHLGTRETLAPAADLDRLRRLLSLSRQLNSELRLEPLLDQVIDAAVELTRAERAMLVLAGGDSGLEVVTARNASQRMASLDRAGAGLSRAIIDRAVHHGEVVVTAHAESDERFDTSASVAAMGLRSVLAVPLRAKREVLGALYLDHRFRRDAFDDGAVATVRELADIAGVAIGNARLLDEKRRREDEIAALNARLRQEVESTRGALDDALAKLATENERRLRHDYDTIIGRSPAMLELLQLVDRATDTDLPVVIYGESGTGKELVARALHGNGARHAGAFVAVNCGALPEPLLESELFGHARGAFTGAARDRRGLFEVADGGTLFLDELADTSLAMQAKLLRVLQEGELRRVGDDRVRTVNVRVVAASNRPLEALVKSGRFREDLYYRLNVVSVRMPPLRERLDDLPDLCEHVLARTQPRVALSPEALDVLQRYGWPGNVRELENELARAAALCAGVITPTDLSERLRNAPPLQASPSSQLALRPQVESLERTLLTRALEATGGNQSQAAKLLGLSRYGLQKKLKRYGMSADDT